MENLNLKILRMISEMREIGKRPAPSKGGNYNDMLEYRRMQENIFCAVVDAFDDGYRLEMKKPTRITFVKDGDPMCDYGTCQRCGSYVQAWNYCPCCGAKVEFEV